MNDEIKIKCTRCLDSGRLFYSEQGKYRGNPCDCKAGIVFRNEQKKHIDMLRGNDNKTTREKTIDDIKRIVHRRKYTATIPNEDFDEILEMVISQAIIMVEDETYDDNPSFDSLLIKMVDFKDE